MTDVKNKPEKKDDLQGRMAWQEAERLIGYQFTDKTLLQSALTHSSVAATPAQSYERLEFFGDRILGLVLSDWLYRTFEAEDQGELTTRFHALAKGEYLASVCIKLGLQNCLFQENGQKKLAERTSVQADIIEAV
ncbi:MAG: ribonuclease III domain-containing protein, partial [Alphaproteobacteria bacterium]